MIHLTTMEQALFDAMYVTGARFCWIVSRQLSKPRRCPGDGKGLR